MIIAKLYKSKTLLRFPQLLIVNCFRKVSLTLKPIYNGNYIVSEAL